MYLVVEGLFGRRAPHITEFAMVAKALSRSLRKGYKRPTSNVFLFIISDFRKIRFENLEERGKRRTFASLLKREAGALSSAGSERLPYKQRVGGSNPSAPTIRNLLPDVKRALSSAGSERLPYKQRVGGSNPSAPTEMKKTPCRVSFVVLSQSYRLFKEVFLILYG